MANIWDPDGQAGGEAYFCFGYLEDTDTLYLGQAHHAQIIAALIEGGMTWDQLMATRQMWGWGSADEDWTTGKGVLDLGFSTDEARQDKGVKNKMRAAFQQAWPGWKIQMEQGYGSKSQETYGDRARQQYLGERPLVFPDGTKVTTISYSDTHKGQIGVIMGYEPYDYDNGKFVVQWPDGTYDEHFQHELQKIGNVRTAGAYDTPVFESHNGFKCYDTRHDASRDSTGGGGYWSLCFGAVEKQIYFGDTHHAKIIYNLIEQAGHTYESLMAATQKWGWIRRDSDGNLVITFSTDEAAQTQDAAYSQSVVDAIGEYFRRKAYYEGGEGDSNAGSYGERSRSQYFGEPDEPEDQYCDHCDTWYDPDWESHDHDIQYCDTCGEYYDAENMYEEDQHDHVRVSYHPITPETKAWIQSAVSWAKKEIADYGSVDEEEIADWLRENHNFETDSADWVGEKAMEVINSVPEKPDWMPEGLHPVPTKKVLPGFAPAPPPPQVGEKYDAGWNRSFSIVWYDPSTTQVSVKYDDGQTATWTLKQFRYYLTHGTFKRLSHIRVTDLRDAEVFAILSTDFIKLGAAGDIIPTAQEVIENTIYNKAPIEIGSQWKDDEGKIHTVTDVQNGRVYYTFGDGYGDMGESVWNYYMKPLSTVITDALQQHHDLGLPSTPVQSQPNQIVDPQAEGAMKDDPQLLAIERNPESQEYRWSMDDNQLHIWRVLNRWQYGPSHYDMFGQEGYRDHSQGRVYVSPDGKVGVLYWQVNHPTAEQTLNDWVQKTFGKQPDMVYRAYGGYKGYNTPRWYFPIVEVSGLPIGSYGRWWEKGDKKPDAYYYDRGLSTPNKKIKDYPAKKQQTLPLEEMQADDFNPKKRKRRQKRQRSKQYRNRSRR